MLLVLVACHWHGRLNSNLCNRIDPRIVTAHDCKRKVSPFLAVQIPAILGAIGLCAIHLSPHADGTAWSCSICCDLSWFGLLLTAEPIFAYVASEVDLMHSNEHETGALPNPWSKFLLGVRFFSSHA